MPLPKQKFLSTVLIAQSVTVKISFRLVLSENIKSILHNILKINFKYIKMYENIENTKLYDRLKINIKYYISWYISKYVSIDIMSPNSGNFFLTWWNRYLVTLWTGSLAILKKKNIWKSECLFKSCPWKNECLKEYPERDLISSKQRRFLI